MKPCERAYRRGHWIEASRLAYALKYLGEMLSSWRNASCCRTSSAAAGQIQASAPLGQSRIIASRLIDAVDQGRQPARSADCQRNTRPTRREMRRTTVSVMPVRRSRCGVAAIRTFSPLMSRDNSSGSSLFGSVQHDIQPTCLARTRCMRCSRLRHRCHPLRVACVISVSEMAAHRRVRHRRRCDS